MSISTTINFSNPANFTFDPLKIEVTGSLAQILKNSFNGKSYAKFDTNVNLNFGGGVLTGTPVNGAAIASGQLDLTGSTNKYVEFNAVGNADMKDVGCIRFTVIPNYTGFPSVGVAFFSVMTAPSNPTNVMQLVHTAGGDLNLDLFDNGGGGGANLLAIGFTLTAGTPYEFEVNWNITIGEIRVFCNGTQVGGTIAAVYPRDPVSILRIGTSFELGGNSEFFVKDFVAYNTVQHIADYTPFQSYFLYHIDNPTISPITSIDCDALYSMNAVVSAAGSDSVRFALLVNGALKYWNGLAWASSTGFAQSNLISDLTPSVMSQLGISAGGARIYPIAYLHSNDGSTTPSISSITIVYDFHAIIPDIINKCAVWGYVLDEAGAPIPAVQVSAQLVHSANYKTSVQLTTKPIVTTSDFTGYWELNLIETVNIMPRMKYRFTFIGNNIKREEKKSVPNLPSAAYSTLQ